MRLFLASLGRMKTSGFLILEGQTKVPQCQPFLRVPVGWLLAAAGLQAGSWTHWLSVRGFMSSWRTLKKLTTCWHREILWGRLTKA